MRRKAEGGDDGLPLCPGVFWFHAGVVSGSKPDFSLNHGVMFLSIEFNILNSAFPF